MRTGGIQLTLVWTSIIGIGHRSYAVNPIMLTAKRHRTKNYKEDLSWCTPEGDTPLTKIT